MTTKEFIELTADDCEREMQKILSGLIELNEKLPGSLELKISYLNFVYYWIKSVSYKNLDDQNLSFKNLTEEYLIESDITAKETEQILGKYNNEHTSFDELFSVFAETLKSELPNFDSYDKKMAKYLYRLIHKLIRNYQKYFDAWVTKGAMELDNASKKRFIGDTYEALFAIKSIYGKSHSELIEEIKDIVKVVEYAQPKRKNNENLNIIQKYSDLWQPGAKQVIHDLLRKTLNKEDQYFLSDDERRLIGFTGPMSKSELVTFYITLKEKGYLTSNNNTEIGKIFFEYFDIQPPSNKYDFSKPSKSLKLVDEYKALIPTYEKGIEN